MAKLNLKNFSSSDIRVKYASAKQAVILSKENPSEVYSNFDFFANLFNSPNNVLKWTGIQIVGNLSKVDKKGKVDKLLSRIFEFLKSGKLITINHTIVALSDIAIDKPEYLDRITKELLKIEKYNFEIPECKNIVIGKTLWASGKLFNRIKNKEMVLAFIQRQTKNSRNATKTKAKELFNKISKGRT